MRVRYFQKGFNYAQDGPGNRLVVHMQGCNLHCPWCSNPEGMAIAGGTQTDTAELADFILSCKRLFFDDGGVTFTGGECTLQADALFELLTVCRQNGIHTAIETNGTFAMPPAFYGAIDLILCDCKHYDADKLARVTGCPPSFRDNVAAYLASGKPIVVRTPLIQGFNASDGDAERLAEFFDGMATDNARFEFLPYHEYGKAKWEKLGKTYAVHDGFVPAGTVERFEAVFARHHLKTVRS